MDKLDMIYDLVKETREAQKDHAEVQKNQADTLSQLQTDLTIHIQKTDNTINNNSSKINTNLNRIEKLEEPKRVRKAIVKYTLGIGSVCGALYAILRFVQSL